MERKKQKKNTLQINVATIHGWPTAGASIVNHKGTANAKLRNPQPPSVTRLNPKTGNNAVAAICTGVSRKTNE